MAAAQQRRVHVSICVSTTAAESAVLGAPLGQQANQPNDHGTYNGAQNDKGQQGLHGLQQEPHQGRHSSGVRQEQKRALGKRGKRTSWAAVQKGR